MLKKYFFIFLCCATQLWNFKSEASTLVLNKPLMVFQQSNPDVYNTYPNMALNYRISSSRNGLTETHFKANARIRIQQIGQTAQLVLNIASVQSTPTMPDPHFLYSYMYQGKEYGDQHLRQSAFASVKANAVRYEAYVAYRSKSFTKVVDGIDNLFDVDKDLKASEVTVYVKIASIGSFNGTASIEASIRALQSQAAAAAKPAETTAAATKPAETTTTARSNNERNTSGSSNYSLGGNRQQTTPPYNSNTTSGTNRGSASSSSGTPPTGTPVVGISDGKYYRQNTNGSYTQISEQDYRAAKQQNVQRNTPPPPPQPTINPSRYLLKAPTSDGATTQQAFSKLGNMLSSMAAEARADREQKEARDEAREDARLAAQAAREQAEYEAKMREINRVAALRQLREYAVLGLTTGRVPLSSQKVPVNEIYFFACLYNTEDFEKDSPFLYVSNVFPVAQHGDGTWPFHKTIEEELTKANKGRLPMIIGYYTSLEAAEKARTLYLSKCDNAHFKMFAFEYKGKRASGNTGDTDYWGNKAVKQKTADTPAKTGSDDDFWGTPQKTGTDKLKAKEEPKKAADDDFWGTPQKQTTENKAKL